MKTRRIVLGGVLGVIAAVTVNGMPAFASTTPDAASAASAVARTAGEAGDSKATPARLHDGIALDDAGTMRLHVRETSDAPRKIVDGRAIYAGSARQTSTVVQRPGESTQVLTVIDGPQAPTQYRFDLTLGAGMQLVPGQGGTVLIQKSGATVGLVDAPWAKDSKGRSVPTGYRVEGNTIVQTVAHRGAAYPVVADPRVTIGRFIYVTFNRSETTRVASHSDYLGLVAAACGLIPLPGANVACAVIVGALAIQLSNTFKSAASQSGKCAQMRFNVILFPVTTLGSYSGSSVVNC